MKKFTARIGEEYLCGTILGDDGYSGRHPMVTFQCAHCPLTGRARFSEVRSCVAKSCGCRKKRCFVDYCDRGLSWLKEDEYKTIFELAELHGNEVAATQTGRDRYLISFAWQKRCKEIAGWHPGLLAAVYQTCQISSFDHAMGVYSLSRAEIKRINLISRRAILAAHALSEAERLQAAKADARLRHADDKEVFLAQSILSNTRSNLEVAISNLDTEGGWRNGTFMRKELQKNLKKRSDYGWMYHHLSAMSSDQVNTCYGLYGQRFLNACDYTFLVRDQNVREFLDQDSDYELDTSSPMTNQVPVPNQVRKTPVRREYLSMPRMTPVEAAEKVVMFVSNLRWLRNPDRMCRSYDVNMRKPRRTTSLTTH